MNSRPLGHYVRRPGVGRWRLGAELDRHTKALCLRCWCATRNRDRNRTIPHFALVEKKRKKSNGPPFSRKQTNTPSTYLPPWLYFTLPVARYRSPPQRRREWMGALPVSRLPTPFLARVLMMCRRGLRKKTKRVCCPCPGGYKHKSLVILCRAAIATIGCGSIHRGASN